MKKIKKLFSVIALLVFSSALMPVIGAFTKLSNAIPETNFSYLTVEEFEDEANVGSTYVIKNAKVWDNASGTITLSSASATVSVKDPIGADVELADNAGEKSFKVNYVGNYEIIYTYNGYSQAVVMTAKQGIYSFKFDENSKQIIPAYVNNTKYTGKIVLPNPTVLDEDGNKIESATVEVKVLSPEGTYLDATALTKNAEGFYEFTPNVIGNWTVNYLYKSADGKVLASQTKSFTANNTYNNDFKLQIVGSSSKPTTAITGVTTKLPTVTGKNSVTGDKVDISYSISAKRVVYNSVTGKKVSEEDATACLQNTNEFTPDKDGDYIITYTAKNFFGNTATWEYSISGVKDTKAPTVRLVEPFATTPSDIDASYVLPEKAGLNNIVLPAIWADDNVDKALDKLTLTRKIVKSNNDVIYESSENPNKELVFNFDSASYTLNEDTQVAVTLAEGVTFGAGTYTISYIAKDSAGNEATAVSYKLVLDSAFVADTEKPEVKWSESEAIPSAVRVGETIKFSKPVATDDISTRIKLVVEYQFVTGAETEDWTVLELKDNQYTIEAENADKLVIRATATDAYGNSETIRKEIQIHETNDTQPTKIISVEKSATETGARQQNEIELRTVKYEDDYADFVQVNAYVYVEKDGKTVELNTYDMTKNITYGSLDSILVENAKVWASYAGDYKVSFVSKDIKNNITIMFYSVTVAGYTDSAEIEFGKLPTTLNGGTLELGEQITMPTAEIKVPDGYTSTYNVRKISGPNGELLNKSTFKPAKVGTYVIEYYGSYNDGSADYTVEPVQFTVEVKDTTKPVIDEIYVEPVVALDYALTIPQFTASDLNGIDVANSQVVLSSKSYGTKTIPYGDTTTNRVVTLRYNEVYTLTFTVKDLAGNTTTVTKQIKVGDTEPPVITIDETNKTFVAENVKLNSKLTLDLSLVKVEDLVDTDLSKEDLVITVTRDGETISNIHGDSKTNYEYNIKKAGEYTVTLKITDAAGNVSETVTRKFTVNANENNGMEKNEVIGTILIVVSVLVLAGVIVYLSFQKRKLIKKQNNLK